MHPSPLSHESTAPRGRTLRRNLGFAMLCLLALGLVLGSLWNPPMIESPESFDPAATADDNFPETVTQIDSAFAKIWTEAGIEPTEPIGTHAVIRRLSLALTGTIPSIEEIRALDDVAKESQIDWWIAHLFEDPRYGDYIGERFARAFVGTDGGPTILYRRRRMVSWLSEEFQQNRPYDELSRSLIAAEGVWTSNPAANFVTRTIMEMDKKAGPDEVVLAARVTRAFLGVRIDCMECHNDKFGDHWKQADFHQLAAFFAQAENSLTGVRENEKISYEYRYRGKPKKVLVPPLVPFQAELLPGDGNLRQRLAAWVTHPENKAFARTTVNRVWALMFGKPLVEPIDDIPLEGEIPEAMEILASDFSAHEFDLQRLIRLIAATQVYQLDSRSMNPAQESVWASYPLTRLRPEQIAQSVIQASSLTTIDRDAHVIQRLRRIFETGDFVKRYGDLGEEEFLDQGGTIPQRLLLLNGKLVEERTKNSLMMNAATRISALAGSDKKAVETAYLAILTRAPIPEELTHFSGTLHGTKSKKRNLAMQDLYWALMNSTEFSWNH